MVIISNFDRKEGISVGEKTTDKNDKDGCLRPTA